MSESHQEGRQQRLLRKQVMKAIMKPVVVRDKDGNIVGSYTDYRTAKREKPTSKGFTHHEAILEVKSMMSSLPDDQKRQFILTPIQQLDMRDEVKRCKSVQQAVNTINRYIFGDRYDGEMERVDIDPKIRDPYSLDYAVPNMY